VIIGTTFAWILGLGVFFLAIYTTRAATSNSAANVNVLFGSIFGISPAAAVTAAWVALGLIMVLLVIARPLLFASLDPAAGLEFPGDHGWGEGADDGRTLFETAEALLQAEDVSALDHQP
jgi:hypothetical protein